MAVQNIDLIEAAMARILRFGFAKTTMIDIAREAGVSRQTLYNSYATKEEMISAVVLHEGEVTIADVEGRWEKAESLGEKLDIFFARVPLRWYDLIAGSPEAAELTDAVDGVAKAARNTVLERWAMVIEALLEESYPNMEGGPAVRAALAEFIFSTAMNAKRDAATRSVLERRLSVLKLCVLSIVEDT
ncbi:TetR/AcrR family transcriptional regulator [Alphaproteobacteria bacterium KMM 3653]|uniref:TetR/AcrR family transcriptional regulator n=1 Tax=Harenicola maris TaxID=2841044 RepID=A0AAP2CRV1_9RHOB|nr:TetR/AcrR family transcriptional regulator [Harenicola maris]